MNTYDNDLAAKWKKKKRSKLHNLADVAAMVYDEDERAKKGKAKIAYDDDEEEESEQRFFHHFPRKSRSWVTRRNPRENPFQNLNGASTSMLFDLKQIPYDFESNYLQQLQCPPPSSSDYKISADSETENPQNPRRGEKVPSLLLLLDCMTETKNPRNPNSQLSLTESRSRKRRAVLQSKRNGGLKKAKIAPFSLVAKETPEWLVQLNGAEDVRFIFEKTLVVTDIDPTKSRLLIPFKGLIRNDFLTPVESRFIHGQGGNYIDDEGKPGIGAILVSEKSGKWGVILKIWKMNNTDNYTLTCGWNEFVEANGLKLGDNISLWSFRYQQVLCFALLVTPPTMAQSSSSLALW